MFKKTLLVLMLFIALILGTLPADAQGEGDTTAPNNLYFLAADSAGIYQVWMLTEAESPPAQLTQAATDIIDFAIAADGSAAAYTTDNAVWFTRFTEEQPVRLAEMTPSDFPTTLALNADGSLLAYSNNGIWLTFTDGSTAPTLLVEDIPFAPDQSMEVTDTRIYREPHFIPGTDLLQLEVAIWESVISGVLDTKTGALRELSNTNYNRSVPLREGLLAAYSNSVRGNRSIEFYALDDLSIPVHTLPGDRITEPGALIPAIIQDIVELEPGKIRFATIKPADTENTQAQITIYDYILTTQELTEKSLVYEGTVDMLQFSPDGRWLVGHADIDWNTSFDPHSIPSGTLMLFDAENAIPLDLAQQLTVIRTAWQSR